MPNPRRVPDPNSPAYTVSHAGLPPREHPRLDHVKRAVRSALILAAIAAVSVAAVYGHTHSHAFNTVTNAVLQGLVVGLVYPLWALVQGIRGNPHQRWPRLAGFVVGTALLVAFYALFLAR